MLLPSSSLTQPSPHLVSTVLGSGSTTLGPTNVPEAGDDSAEGASMAKPDAASETPLAPVPSPLLPLARPQAAAPLSSPPSSVGGGGDASVFITPVVPQRFKRPAVDPAKAADIHPPPAASHPASGAETKISAVAREVLMTESGGSAGAKRPRQANVQEGEVRCSSAAALLSGGDRDLPGAISYASAAAVALPMPPSFPVVIPTLPGSNREEEVVKDEGRDSASLRRIRAEVEEEFRVRLHEKLREAAGVVRALADREISDLKGEIVELQGKLEHCEEELRILHQRLDEAGQDEDREYWTGMVKKVRQMSGLTIVHCRAMHRSPRMPRA